jgi:hypothetical protein
MTQFLDRLRRTFSAIARVGLALLALSLASPAHAADAADQAAYDAAFDAMQRDPGNSDKALAYAEAAIKVGDLEGAIGALERLLIFNPDLPRIRLEVGVLYYRLGSYDLSRSYLSQLAARSDLPPDVRDKVQEYLAQIDRQASPHRITGGVIAGFRYQTNATYGSSSSGLSILGLSFPQASNTAGKGDANFFGLGSVNYVYDFQQAEPLTVEANLTMYGAKQFRQTFLDLSLTQIDVGPRIGLPNLLEGASVRPYVIGDYLSLGGSHFLASYGGGVNVVAPVMDRLSLLSNFEIQNRQYYMDPGRPRIEDRTGDYVAIRLSPQYALADNQIVGFIAEYDQTLASQAYERNYQVVLGPTYQIRFGSPVPETGLVRPWTASLGFDHIWRYYNKPDLLVDPFNTRNDSQYDIGGTLEVPVVDGLSALLQAQQTWQNSNIQNYKYTNTIGMMALSLTF